MIVPITFGDRANAQIDTEIKLGDLCPDIKIANIVNYNLASGYIHDFKGKWLILDFWATWCAPCVNFLKSADSLQKEYGRQLTILPVSYEAPEKVSNFLQRYKEETGRSIPSVVNDSILSSIFKHKIVPHEVWIDPDGRVRGISSEEDVNVKTIDYVLAHKMVPFKEKVDEENIEVDRSKPILTGTQNIQVDDDELLFHSVLTRYKKGLLMGGGSSANSYTLLNTSIVWLYKIAIGQSRSEFFPDNRLMLQVKDSSVVTYPWEPDMSKFDSWKQHNTYCYEVHIGDTAIRKDMFEFMRNDLNRYFSAYGIQGKLERRKMECFVLTRISSKDKIRSKGGAYKHSVGVFNFIVNNAKMDEFISEIQSYYLVNSKLPIVDGTGYSEDVDIELDCNMSSLESINAALVKYDLEFRKEEKEIDMIVISQQ